MHHCLINKLPPSVNAKFSFAKTHQNTKGVRFNQLDKLIIGTIHYGTNCIKSKSVDAWNLVNENCEEKVDYLVKK